ncbi:uncharacterized protein PRCAT00000993001 [Priceomyces carsonii]|uniref:uncharacterized protein n=1 Tax=Priceomyces carsonii TaxID=28549 RepID=UPI002ED7D474|nr:unnamed protein product [Priceomyces carsonii]
MVPKTVEKGLSLENRKPKNTKSRNGCLTCKKKRLKCDETKPECHNCQKKNLICGGYATNFKWRSFNNGTDISGSELPKLSDKSMHKKRLLSNDSFTNDGDHKRRLQDEIFKKQLELASLSVTGKTINEIKFQNDLIAKGMNPNSYKSEESKYRHRNDILEQKPGQKHSKSKRSISFTEGGDYGSHRSPLHRTFSTGSPSRFDLRNEIRKNNALDSLAEAAVDVIKGRPSSEQHLFSKDEVPPPPMSFSPMSDYLPIKDATVSNYLNSSPKDTEISNSPGALTKISNEFVQDLNLTPSLSAIINFAFTNEDPKNNLGPEMKMNFDFPLSPLNLSDADLQQNGTLLTATATASVGDSHHTHTEDEFPNGRLTFLNDSQSPASGLDSISPSPYLHGNKSLMRTSEQEQILYLYSRHTCAIMSIKNGPNENPWRRMIIPIATNYPCLFNSLASMTLFHLAGNSQSKLISQSLRNRGYVYMKKCILELATNLSKARKDSDESQDLPADIALTTCLNLAVSESWDTHTSSGIAHLKGAKSMIQKVLTILRKNQQELVEKTKEINKSPGTPEYGELVQRKLKELQKSLVLVLDHEWERVIEDNRIISCDNDEKSGEAFKSSDAGKPENCLAIPESLQFLFNIWIYFEVLAQMTTDSNQDDKGIDLVATITRIGQTQDEKKMLQTKFGGDSKEYKGERSPSTSSLTTELSIGGNKFNFFQDFETFTHNADYIDPLLGCGQSLFLIIGAAASLISKIRKARKVEFEKKEKQFFSRNSLPTITAASNLKQQLMDWKPTITSSMLGNGLNEDNNSTWDISSCIATAEAYRYATLLFLHQAVPEIPSLSSHELAEKIFILLASIPTSSHLYVIHIFPLLVSSCEADAGEEREWCESRWKVLSERLWIGNVDRALEVVKEVWKRRDEHGRRHERSERRDGKLTKGDPKLKNICSQISGLMAVINSDNLDPNDDIYGSINSKLHWSTVMREWGWEVLLG